MSATLSGAGVYFVERLPSANASRHGAGTLPMVLPQLKRKPDVWAAVRQCPVSDRARLDNTAWKWRQREGLEAHTRMVDGQVVLFARWVGRS